MNTIGAGVNSLTGAQFTQKAMRVATQQAATVKDQKDLKTNDEKKDEDSVMLSDKAKQAKAMSAAQQSGVMSELAEKQKKKEADPSKINMFGGDDEHYEGQVVGEEAAEQGESKEVGGVSAKDSAKINEALNRTPEEIMADVPQGFATAAKKIVSDKIKNNKPTKELSGLKEVPDTANIEIKPEKMVEIMPIHDSSNRPINIEMEGAGLNT